MRSAGQVCPEPTERSLASTTKRLPFVSGKRLLAPAPKYATATTHRRRELRTAFVNCGHIPLLTNTVLIRGATSTLNRGRKHDVVKSLRWNDQPNVRTFP